MPSVELPGRSLVVLAGADAQSFLQNVVTVDVDALGTGELRAGALLSPQGKILFDFLVSRRGETLVLDCRTAVAGDLAKRLTMYRLRAKVEIGVEDQGVVQVSWGDESGDGLSDTRFAAALGVRRRYGAAGLGDRATGDAALWDALRVHNGVAESGSDYALGDAFPHDVLLDQNNGVGFRKGCFVGQEVVSRMQHRGTARRRILVAESAMPLPEPGTEITAQARGIGTLGTVSGGQALALVRIDRVADADADGVPILAGEAALELHVPPGMGFAIPSPGPASAE